ncbi:MAG: hypothetical protein LBQ66_14985 [Planctomycetaceae bacterium]|jgi:hypothetical protein|nr:hypothetical protein [Planctomycetaceae bacterium]
MTNLDIDSLDFDPLEICKYLTAKHWKKIPTNKSRTHLFCHPVDAYSQVYVPLDVDIPSFRRSVLEIIDVLHGVENRPKQNIIDDLLYPDNDIIRYRIQSPQSTLGTVPLSAIDQLVGAVVKNFKSSILDVLSPRLHHPSMKNKEMDLFLQNTRFAEPERGSFVVKILCPLFSVDSYEPALIQPNPIARQVTTHLLTAAQRLVSVIENNQQEEFIDHIKADVKQDKISADLCLSLSQTQIWDDSSLELSSQWSVLLPQDIEVPHSVKIPKTYFSHIAKIADAITPSPREQKPEKFIAIVDECHGDINEDGKREGLVVLQVFNDGGEKFKATTNLTPEQYQVANEFHGTENLSEKAERAKLQN